MSDPNVKIWIGNLDYKLTEYQLLKLVERFGRVTSYDFLYHINERGTRTPRGYAFVTFESSSSAAEAIKNLHNKKILSKELIVRYASSKQDPTQKINDKIIPSALKAGSSKQQLTQDEKAKKIAALEAKLKLMENGGASTATTPSNGHQRQTSTPSNGHGGQFSTPSNGHRGHSLASSARHKPY